MEQAVLHPGEVLNEIFLKPMLLTHKKLAHEIGIPLHEVREIILRKRHICASTALRLAQYFGNRPKYWLELQMDYDLYIASKDIGDRLKKEVRSYAEAG